MVMGINDWSLSQSESDSSCWKKDGQQIIMNEIWFTKKMTIDQAVALIGKHGASTLLALEKTGKIRKIKRGLYGTVLER